MLSTSSTRHLRSVALILLLLGSWCKADGQEQGKDARAAAIFERLVMARGDARTPPPKFVFSRQNLHGASSADGTITLEETAYDVCMSFGDRADAALAGILAHELIHYYNGHEWEDGFISLVDADRQENGLSEIVGEDNTALTKDEIEADYLGGFLAHLAGYPSTRVMPEVLAGIYVAYKLPEKLTNYPSLPERQTVALSTADRLDVLVNVFEVGNLLAALGRYEEALPYYTFLLGEFQSRELYNNQGVLYAMAALSHFDPAGLPHVYPFQLDFQSRMTTGSRNLTHDRGLREAMLQEGIKMFETAVLLDEDYLPGYLNLACAKSLLAHSMMQGTDTGSDPDVVEDLLLGARLAARKARRKLVKPTNPTTERHVELVTSIIDSQMAGEDTQALPGENIGASPLTGDDATGFTMRESIGGSTVDDLLLKSVDWTNTLAIDGSHVPTKLKTAISKEAASIQTLFHEYGKGGILFLKANALAAGATSLDISVGSSLDDVMLEYGTPERQIALASGGTILVYPKSELIFLMGDNEVVTWYLYRELR